MITFSYIIGAITEVIIIDMCARRIFLCSPSKLTIRYSFLGAYIFLSVLHVSLNYSIVSNLVTSIFLVFMVTIGYTKSWMKRIEITTLSFAIGTISEGILWIYMRITSDLSGFEISPDLHFFILTNFLTSLLKIIVIVLFCLFVNYIKSHPPALYSVILSMTGTLLTILLFCFVSFSERKYLPIAVAVAGLVVIMLILCIGMFQDQSRVQQERLRLDFLENQNHNQIAHYTALFDRNNEVHQLRHDLHNFIISAQALIDLGDLEKLKQHLNKQSETIRPPTLVDTGNPLLDAVLSAKRDESKIIDFQILIPQLKPDAIDPMDVAMLLASAIDNAIDGCAGVSDPYIQIKIRQTQAMIFITVKNPTLNTPIEKFGRIVTTKSDKERHGYGILGMKRTAERYDGSLVWKIEEGIFSLQIMLQDISPRIK